jgi:hypothetical protein
MEGSGVRDVEDLTDIRLAKIKPKNYNILGQNSKLTSEIRISHLLNTSAQNYHSVIGQVLKAQLKIIFSLFQHMNVRVCIYLSAHRFILDIHSC